MSLDGYIARPDGAIDWLASVELPGEDFGYADFARRGARVARLAAAAARTRRSAVHPEPGE
jgi:hypothetical protein